MRRTKWVQLKELFAIAIMVIFKGAKFHVGSPDDEYDEEYWPIYFQEYGDKD